MSEKYVYRLQNISNFIKVNNLNEQRNNSASLLKYYKTNYCMPSSMTFMESFMLLGFCSIYPQV